MGSVGVCTEAMNWKEELCTCLYALYTYMYMSVRRCVKIREAGNARKEKPIRPKGCWEMWFRRMDCLLS